MVEDELNVWVGVGNVGAGGDAVGADEEVVDESSAADRGQPGGDVGAAQPPRVRLVLDLVSDSHEAAATGTIGQAGELVADRRGGEVDPSDDSGDQPARGDRRGEELLGFG